MHDLILRNAQRFDGSQWKPTDIAIDDGRFTAFDASDSSAKETIDAQGRYCLPGGVDLHVHFNEPGRTHWEGFATGSLAAAAGGVSFLVEMPLNSIPSTVSLDSLQTKLEAIGAQSTTDYGLWGGLVPGNAEELVPMAEAGVAGFKAFMSPSGTDDFVNSDPNTLKEGMEQIAKTGKILALHAEDPQVLAAAAQTATPKQTAIDWERSRPIEAEMSAVRIALDLAGETGCRLHIVHVSAPEVLSLIAAGKAQGIDVTCETCPHYLLLSIEQSDAIGPAAKCAPPLRPGATVDALWRALGQGMIQTIGSDHSPSPPEMKTGAANFYQAWGGISGVQHGLPLLWEKTIQDPALFSQILTLSTANPSQLIGLGSKGSLALGMDADFSLVEQRPSKHPIHADDLLYRHRHSAYCGLPLSLHVAETWQRGYRIYKRGAAPIKPRGRFMPFPIN